MNYYNNLAKKYFDKTVNIDMSEHYNNFLSYLKREDRILDVGCGSGRDSRYFIEKGFEVDSIDNSVDLSLLASMYIGKNVINKDMKEIDYNNEYNGIWCSASLLHIMPSDITDVIERLSKALKKNGFLYISLKKGENNIVEEEGRTTVLYDYGFITNILLSLGFVIKKYYTSEDTMGRKTTWFTIIAEKI